jgi:hypothetical protein
MIVYLILIIFELLIGFYWLFYQYIHFLNGSILIIYLFVFPIIYFILTLKDVLKLKNYFKYFLSLIPIIGLFLFAFLKDGKTKYIENPDSSLFGWFIGFSLIRFIFFFIGFLIIIIFYNLKKNKNIIK